MATAAISTIRKRFMVASTSRNDRPTRLTDPSGARDASMRKRPEPPALPTVNGSCLRAACVASVTVTAGRPTRSTSIGRMTLTMVPSWICAP